jgi:hypothetical protein
MVTGGSITPLRDFEHVESKFGFNVRQRVFFICDHVAIFPFQPRIQEGHRKIHGHEVPFIVRGVVRESPKRKCVAVEILGIAQQS